MRDEWGLLRERFEERRLELESCAGGNPVAARLAAPVAVLDLTEALAQDILGLDAASVTDDLWAHVLGEAADSDRPEAALRAIASWAVAQRRHFWSATGTTTDGPFRGIDGRVPIHDGWMGRWDAADDWDFIAVFPQPLRRVLKEEGFDVEATLRVWRQRGWIEVDRDGMRFTKSMRIDGQRAGVICITRTAIDTAGSAVREQE